MASQYGLPLLRQLQAGGSGFELGGAEAARHGSKSFYVPDMSRRWVWKHMDAHIGHMEGFQRRQWLSGMPMEAYGSPWKANRP